MTTADDSSGGHVPLPPEQPSETPEQPSEPPPAPLDLTKSPPVEPPPSSDEDALGGDESADPSGGGGEAAGGDWWRWPDVREEWGDAWAQHGNDAMEAAAEVGQQIGDAIADRLPDQTAQGQQLDFSWMHLKLNIPAVLLAALLVWSGNNPMSALGSTVVRNGIFAPLGWLLVPSFLLGGLMLLPIGHLAANLVGSALRGCWQVLVRAWGAPGSGYVLRLLLAIAAWSCIFTVVSLAGRTVIHWLTGA